MNNSEFGFETQAIRSQLERTQYLEHSVPKEPMLILSFWIQMLLFATNWKIKSKC